MTTLADFVGVPFADHGRTREGADCWGLVRAALKECAGIEMPDYGQGYADVADHDRIGLLIRDGVMQGWERVSEPRRFDVVIFHIGETHWHVGLMLNRVRFLHCPEWVTLPDGTKTAGTSRTERIDDRLWHRRVEGVYRYVG